MSVDFLNIFQEDNFSIGLLELTLKNDIELKFPHLKL
jgi:hypothetical protein